MRLKGMNIFGALKPIAMWLSTKVILNYPAISNPEKGLLTEFPKVLGIIAFRFGVQKWTPSFWYTLQVF